MLGFGLTSAAVAEDKFDSDLFDIKVNTETRRWNDKNTDAQKTFLALSHCIDSSYGGSTADPRFELRRNVSLRPDATYGEKQMGNCRGKLTSKDWGRMTTKGDYFLRYRGINHTSNRLFASAVTVKW